MMRQRVGPVCVLISTIAWIPGCSQSGAGSRAQTTSPAAEAAAAPAVRFLDPEHAPRGPGWIALFNGRDLTGWRKRDANAVHSWTVDDAILRNKADHKKEEGVDLVSDRTFLDFEAYYEYRVPPNSNSGFYLRGRYEIQIRDSLLRPNGKNQNGALYGIAAPSVNASREANQWQSAYVRLVGRRVTVILNGTTIIDNVEADRATGEEIDRNYDQPGPILLQGNHGPVDFRYIFVRPLPNP